MYVSIYANAIFIIIAILNIFFYLVGWREASGLLSTITSFLNGMYAVFTGMCPEWFVYIHLLVQIPSIIVCTFSYILGVNGVRYILPETKKNINNQTR